jgi:hypothetical protein
MEPAKMADGPYDKLAAFLSEHDGIASVSDLAEIAGIDDHLVRAYCRARGVRRIGSTFAFGKAAAYAALDEILGEARSPVVLPAYEALGRLEGAPGQRATTGFVPLEWPSELIAIHLSESLILRSVSLANLSVALSSDHPLVAARSVDALPLSPVSSYVPSRTRILGDPGSWGVLEACMPEADGARVVHVKVEFRPFRMFEKRR